MSPKVCLVFTSPVPFATVIAPPPIVHRAAFPLESTQLSRFFPSNRMIASEGGAEASFPGDTMGGSGCQTSVSFGSGLSWEKAAMVIKRISVAHKEYFIVQWLWSKINIPDLKPDNIGLHFTEGSKIICNILDFFAFVVFHRLQDLVRSESHFQLVS